VEAFLGTCVWVCVTFMYRCFFPKERNETTVPPFFPKKIGCWHSLFPSTKRNETKLLDEFHCNEDRNQQYHHHHHPTSWILLMRASSLSFLRTILRERRLSRWWQQKRQQRQRQRHCRSFDFDFVILTGCRRSRGVVLLVPLYYPQSRRRVTDCLMSCSCSRSIIILIPFDPHRCRRHRRRHCHCCRWLVREYCGWGSQRGGWYNRSTSRGMERLSSGRTSRGNKGKLFGDHWRRDTILLSSLWVQAKVRFATVTVLPPIIFSVSETSRRVHVRTVSN